MSNQYTYSQETACERQEHLQPSGLKRRFFHTRHQSSPLVLTNLSFLNSSSNLSVKAIVPANINDFARFLHERERRSTQLRKKTNGKLKPVKSLSILQKNKISTSSFNSNLECLNETSFMRHVPSIEHFDKLDPDASVEIYLKYKKRMISFSKTATKGHKSEICLRALKSHFMGIPL